MKLFLLKIIEFFSLLFIDHVRNDLDQLYIYHKIKAQNILPLDK